MKFLFDFFPIVLFFIAYQLSVPSASDPAIAQTFSATVILGVTSTWLLFADLFFAIETKLFPTQGNFFFATGVLIAATIAQMLILLVRGKKIENMHKINFILVLGLGALTIFLQNQELLKIKVSIINWLFGAVFLASQFISRRTLVERMMSHAIQVPSHIWTRLNLMWATFFLFLGFLNWYVMHNFSEGAWVNFKFYGLLGLTIAFVLVQGVYLARHVQEKSSEPA